VKTGIFGVKRPLYGNFCPCTLATQDGDVRFFPINAILYVSPGDVVPITKLTNTYPHTGLPIQYVWDPTEMMYIYEQNDLISNIGNPVYAYYPFEDKRSFEFVNWCISNKITQTAGDQQLKGQCYPLQENIQQSIKSVYCLKMLIKKMEDGLGMKLWMEAKIDRTQNTNHCNLIKFWHRDPIETAKWLL